jgi:selenocysteine lyase/cysteine desulfurase
VMDRFRGEIWAQFEGYYGLKRSFAAIIILWSIFALILINSKHRFVPVVGEFIIVYWFRNVWTIGKLLGLIVAMMWLLKSNVLKRQYTKFFGYREHLEPPIYRIAPTWHWTLPAVGMVVLWVPFIDLYTRGLKQYSLLFSLLLPMILRSLLAAARVPRADHVDRLAKFHYQKRYFNPAGLGAKCPSLDERVSGINHHSASRHAIISGQEGTVWKGVNDLLIKLADYLGCDARLMTLHERTTDAVQFAVDECCRAFAKSGKGVRIVYSDAEYPNLVDTVLRKAEADFSAQLCRADILSSIIAGRDSNHINETIIATCKSAGANMLVISHVVFSFGYVIDIGAIIKELGQRDLRLIVIVDGAQSMGNIADLQPAIRAAEYYIGCSQKWLSTGPNLGILVRNETTLLRELVAMRYPGRPYSRLDSADELFSLTIPLVPYYELCVLLNEEFRRLGSSRVSEHNAKLAGMFIDEVRAVGYRVLPQNVRNGIVGIELDDEAFKDLGERLDRADMHYAPIPVSVGGKKINVLRVSFHFYHDSHDVYELIRIFNDARRENEIVRGRRGYVSTG